jgi:hypothetical protein
MVSLEGRRTSVLSIPLMLIACLPGIAASQPGRPADAAEQKRIIVAERIEKIRAKGGAYSSELIDPLTTLAGLYQESGKHDLAAAVTEEAMQVIRANYGLRSLDQAPLLREQIRNEEARGNYAESWQLEQVLLTVARANRDDLRSAAIFTEIGDKRMDLLRRYLANELPPQLQLGCYYERRYVVTAFAEPVAGACTSGSRRVATQSMLVDAQANYAAAIGVLTAAGQYSSPELRDLELDLVRSTYSYGGNYETGRQALRRLIAYEVAVDAPLADRAAAFLQIADWDLLYDYRAAALDGYASTYELMTREGVEPAEIDALFSPEIPIVLPAFDSSPLTSSPSDEYIDVSFEITRYGKSGRVNVLAKTANVSDEIEELLVRFIKQRRFRPRVVDGAFPRSSHVELRYYANGAGAKR